MATLASPLAFLWIRGKACNGIIQQLSLKAEELKASRINSGSSTGAYAAPTLHFKCASNI